LPDRVRVVASLRLPGFTQKFCDLVGGPSDIVVASEANAQASARLVDLVQVRYRNGEFVVFLAINLTSPTRMFLP
jgi:hypothetical protein